jgi:prepilin-type N-terminal cleavage/methylation domain-containing protein
MPTEPAFPTPSGTVPSGSHGFPWLRRWKSARRRGLTLVEVMVALTLMATIMIGFIGSFLNSRRVTESSVLHAAATSLVYGVIEQMKGLDYTTLLPSNEVDTEAPDEIENLTPYVRVRINQDLTVWLQTVYTAAGATPRGPTTTPSASATAADVGAIDNFIGRLPLSTVTGTASQDLSLNIWLWIDEIPDVTRDVSEVKRITLVYTYSYLDGGRERVVRDREVFLRTRYDQ